MKRIVIIGSGNVAEALARVLPQSGLEPVQVFARNGSRAREVAGLAACGWSSDPALLCRDADLYLIAVSDRAVGEVASALPIPEEAVVAHTAGSVPLDVIPGRYVRRAVFYPMQTFTKGREVDFSTIPIFLETDCAALCPALESVARSLSREVIWATSAQRRTVHLAAVFACNFVNHMYALGERILAREGLEFGVLKALVAETAAKACDAASPANVQTGPAVRHDLGTQSRHLAELASDPLLQTIYSTITQSIWETSKKI